MILLLTASVCVVIFSLWCASAVSLDFHSLCKMKLKNVTKVKGKRDVGTDGSTQKVSQMTVSQLSNDVIWEVS